MAKKSTAWTPVRRGRVYCSPACGGGCTYAAYLNAHSAGDMLARRLGGWWDVRVWENLGWHWELRHGATRLRRHGVPGQYSYTLDLNTRPQIVTTARSPREAVRKAARVVGAITTELARIQGALRAL